MSAEERIDDYVRYGSFADIQESVKGLNRVCLACCAWVKANVERTERNLLLFNVLAGAVPYLELVQRNVDGPIQLIALCTRGLYELDLRARWLLGTEAAVRSWNAELASDRVEVLEGILQLSEPESAVARTLGEEINRIKTLAKKHGLPEKAKLPAVADMAKSLGLEKEHKAFFKLFSKLIHPSSYLVNRPLEANDSNTRNILLLNLQKYGLDLLERIRDDFRVPDALVEPLSEHGGA